MTTVNENQHTLFTWRATEEEKLRVGAWVHFLGGGLGAMFGALATSPLEVVKTRLQAQHHKNQLTSRSPFLGLNTLISVRSLARQEGIFSLYRGLGTHLSGVVPARAIHFFVYGSVKGILSKKMPRESWWIPIISAATAGATVVTVTQPIWLVKTRLQLQTNHAQETLYKSPWDALVKTINNEGKLAIFKGMSASYLGLTETVLQFTIYEIMKNKILQQKATIHEHKPTLSIMEVLLLSSISKLIASMVTYPHEVIRTRLREQKSIQAVPRYKGPFQGMRLIAKEEGLRGLYGGMGAHLLRVVPNAGILFLIYEVTVAYFSRHLQIQKDYTSNFILHFH